MNRENNSFENLHSSQDDVHIKTEGSTIGGTITTSSSSANLIVPKAVLDKLFKDLQFDKEKKRWLADFLCYTK